MDPNNQFDVNRLRSGITPTALYYWSSLPSTNSWALEQLRADQLPPPALVLTSDQTAGRGRLGRQWQSDQGSFTGSWVWHRTIDAETGLSVTAGRLAIRVAWAIFETLARWLPRSQLQVKWPNDLLVDGAKISGVLIESLLSDPIVDVIGIGINVNLQRLPELETRSAQNTLNDPAQTNHLLVQPRQPTSIYHQLGHTVSLTELAIELHRQLERQVVAQTLNWHQLREHYNAHLFGLNRWLALDTPTGPIAGVCVGIDNAGALLVEIDGNLTAVSAGTVTAVDG